jgi:hypothetical protein
MEDMTEFLSQISLTNHIQKLSSDPDADVLSDESGAEDDTDLPLLEKTMSAVTS